MLQPRSAGLWVFGLRRVLAILDRRCSADDTAQCPNCNPKYSKSALDPTAVTEG